MKKIVFELLIVLASFSLFFLLNNRENDKFETKQIIGTIGESGNASLQADRIAWEINRLKDPKTGRIPENIRRRELEFAKTLPKNLNKSKSINWTKRGPWNVGGRTRAAAVDLNDENTIVAGAVSGGVWRSTDSGNSWVKITPPDFFHNISCITQDKRAGKTNIWYYGTGELYGASASAPGAYHYGNGVYKSTDNGLSWQVLESTLSDDVTDFDSDFDFAWNITTDPSIDTADVVFVATYGRIYRSPDGGQTWEAQLGSGSSSSYFTDIAVSTQGVAYATLSSDGSQKGIWRSADGTNWTNITPVDTFPYNYERIVLAINPSNENQVYFLGVTPDAGQVTLSWYGENNYTSLWKYTYVSGDGSDSTNIWENLSENIPASGTAFDQFNAQGSYNLVISINPNNPNTVFIGGTNLYRSTDGFSSSNNTMQIGGYEIGTVLKNFQIYKNHHPDQHVIMYLPSDPNVLISANDGGIFRTDDVFADTVVWDRLNNGYLTTQIYTVGVDFSSTNDIVIGGFQDNGNFFANTDDPETEWVMPLNGDGSFMGIAEGSAFYCLSIQNGKIYKSTLTNDGEVTGFTRIDPIGGSGYQFINPFVMDPNNSDLMYVAAGTKLWRNDSLSHIPLSGNYDSISMGWFQFTDTVGFTGSEITSIAVSKNPANIVYYGTSNKFVYRVENAHTGDPEHERIAPYTFDNGNIGCVAIDPDDANKVVVSYTNYGVYSIKYTEDAGTNWVKVSGNLEEFSNGAGAGPSVRWISILPLPDGKLYFAGTSVGLYATDTLISDSTVWHQVSAEQIGNVVVEMVICRETDGLVVAGTHGNGIFSTHINSVSEIIGTPENPEFAKIELKVFPNPASDKISLSFSSEKSDRAEIGIFDESGKLVKNLVTNKLAQGENKVDVKLTGLSNGIYFCRLKQNKYFGAISFVINK
ncbi:MAG: T9SS type A sorting domain-containing protein [Bacteroidetes bacterium]|jgi:photosystem II stability/assembly factor-like uncharacterized protein|nr:T9SS type A sorting domain-containing protein [Bacteroidota bacterium]MBT6687570.1 T9SS type A sorting domain-containing protein [Bacteroidota bacterium]MBT7142801.1 T9SS type A sorting domain-containing protein [Bacteroidota bacterium]MBT7492004.1 T9SS type A sorting domain-containing protein [Bacteroidota bacterium]